MSIIGLRLLGVFRTIPYTSISRLIPVVWIGVACQVLSGFTLWITKPAQYLSDVMFETKFTLVLISVAVTWYFHVMLGRNAAAWDAAGKVSSRGVQVAAVTCLLWAAVTIGGRLTAYLGSLYPT